MVTPSNGKRNAQLLLLSRWQRDQQLPEDCRFSWSVHSPQPNERDARENLLHAVNNVRMRWDPHLYVVMEDDDYYPETYVADVVRELRGYHDRDAVLLGCTRTRYYHVESGGYETMEHANHSSLMATSWTRAACGFVLDTLQDLKGPFIDAALWARARVSHVIRDLNGPRSAIGLKGWDGHGNGHAASFYTAFDDKPGRPVLRQWIKNQNHADAILQALA